MSTQPEPDYRIAVVLATERGRTAVVALISDLTGPVDTVILERTPKHNYPQRQRRRLVLQVIGSALERIERPSTVGLMCEEEEVVKMLRSVKITGQGPEGDDREFWQLLVAGFRYHNVTQMLQKKRKRMDGLGRLAREAGVAWLEAHPRETAAGAGAGGQLGQISRNAPRGSRKGSLSPYRPESIINTRTLPLRARSRLASEIAVPMTAAKTSAPVIVAPRKPTFLRGRDGQRERWTEGEMEGAPESPAQGHVAAGNRTGVGHPQVHRQELSGGRRSSRMEAADGAQSVDIGYHGSVTE